MSEMMGVVPAAGSGRRLFPRGGAKELLPVGSDRVDVGGVEVETPKLAVQYTLEVMAHAGIERIVMVTRPEKVDLLARHVDPGRYGVHLSYVVGTPASMAHAVDLARPWLAGATVVLGMPDTVVRPIGSVQHLLDHHVHTGSELSLALYPTDQPERFGMVMTNEVGDITYHRDKPAHTEASLMWGLAAWEPPFTTLLHDVVAGLPLSDVELPLGAVFDVALTKGRRCTAVPIERGAYYDIGTQADYRRTLDALWTPNS